MIRCVAIDDEPIALSIIKEHCNKYGDIRLDCFTSPLEGMAFVKENRPDIVFLDIEMNSHNGVELARELPAGTVLIFTTAYAQYALEGFNVNAIDFLHKPIFYSRFEQAMSKAAGWLARRGYNAISSESITLKSEYKKVVVELNTIKYIEAMDNYVKIYRYDKPTVISQITMKEMEGLLPADKFVRVHRSFIVRLEVIESFSNRRIYVRDVDDPIPVGPTYNDTFTALYRQK